MMQSSSCVTPPWTPEAIRVLSAQDPKKRHELDRKLVQELLCALCGERQPAGRHCRKCGVSFGAYACLTCRFFEVGSQISGLCL